MSEITLRGMLSLPFLKRERFTGSHGNMRYMICMEGGKIKAAVYPGPFCWEATSEEDKVFEYFEGTQGGLEQTVDWLNRMYESSFS